MNQRLYIYMFTMFYPGVLGSLLFGFLTKAPGDCLQIAVSVVMGTYFLAQYGESMKAADLKDENGKINYGPWEFLFDILELAAMVTIFAAIEFFDSENGWIKDISKHTGIVWLAMVATFVLPLLGRFAGSLAGSKLESQYKPLAALSCVAAAAAIIGYFAALTTNMMLQWIAMAAVAVALAIYLWIFVFFNEKAGKYVRT